MQRHEVIGLLKELKLHGMAGVFDETISQGIRRQQPVLDILGRFCLAEAAERKVRSIRYQMGVARFPLNKDLDVSGTLTALHGPGSDQLLRRNIPRQQGLVVFQGYSHR
jgi:hypothetical protein